MEATNHKGHKGGPVVVSFDLDFTLANFKREPITALMQDCLHLVLVRDFGYPPDIWPTADEAINDAKERSCFVFDVETMNLIDADLEGFIRTCYFGSEELPQEEIENIYGVECRLPYKPGTETSCRYENFFDLFICYIVPTIRRIVDLKKKSQHPKLVKLTGKQLIEDIYATAKVNYDFVHDGSYLLPEKVGYFYPYLLTNPRKYLDPLSPRFLELLKNPAFFPIIITNGELGHVNAVMSMFKSIGVNLADYFKLICIDAHKPKFFNPQNHKKFSINPHPYEGAAICKTSVQELKEKCAGYKPENEEDVKDEDIAIDPHYVLSSKYLFEGSINALMEKLPKHSAFIHIGDCVRNDKTVEPLKSILLTHKSANSPGLKAANSLGQVEGWTHTVDDIDDEKLITILQQYTANA